MELPESLQNIEFRAVTSDDFEKCLRTKESLFIEYNKQYKIYRDSSHNIFGYVISNGYSQQYYLTLK